MYSERLRDDRAGKTEALGLNCALKWLNVFSVSQPCTLMAFMQLGLLFIYADLTVHFLLQATSINACTRG